MHSLLLFIHIVSASVWTGGHLILALSILPQALRSKSIAELQRFESRFEIIGIPALIIQVITGLWMAALILPEPGLWFALDHPLGRLISFKLLLLLLSGLLALDARLRIIPKLSEDNLNQLAWHIIPVTIISVLFILVGVSFRTGWLS